MTRAVDPAGPDRTVLLTTAVLLVTTGVVLVAGLLVATGSAGAGASSAFGDPGPLTTTGLPVARYLQEVLGALVVGSTLLPVLSAAGPVARRAQTLLGPLAAGWVAATALVYLLTASDLAARPVPRVLTADVQRQFLALPQARAQLLVALAGVVLLVSSRARTGGSPWVARALLAVATAGLLPPVFVGHSAAAADHETAVASVSVHLVAGALWVGGLAVLALLVLVDTRLGRAQALPTVRSFSTLALGCVVVLGASGVLNAALRVGPGDLLTSAYGLLLVAKTTGLLVLVGLGHRHRTRSITEMTLPVGAPGGDACGWTSRARAAFVQLVVVELAVMAATVAAAVVLSRTPPPGLPGG